MICPKCGKETESSKFCMECGAKLQTICYKCSAEIPIGSKFCPECGDPILYNALIERGMNSNALEAFKKSLQSSTLEAISILREQTGLSLKEAKIIVDSLK